MLPLMLSLLLFANVLVFASLMLFFGCSAAAGSIDLPFAGRIQAFRFCPYMEKGG